MKKFEGYQHGINLGGWLSQCNEHSPEYYNSFIREEDLKTIAGWGLDHVRLPIDVDVFEPEPGKVSEDGIRHIDECIGWCRKYGLNMILDLHKAHGFMFDTGAVPDPDKFFTDEDLQQTFYNTWEMLIGRYAKDDDIVAFELLNEVVNPDFAEKWNEMAQKAISIIRNKTKKAYIIVGGVCHNSVSSVKMLRPPYDDRIIYTFHCYEPLCFTHQHAYWVENIDYDLNYPAPIKLYKEKSELLNQNHAGAIFDGKVSKVGSEFFEVMFEEAIKYAEKMDVPLYCGEYGVIDKAPTVDSLNWLTDISKVFDKYGIGRALWTYKSKDFGLCDLHFAPIKEQMIRLL